MINIISKTCGELTSSEYKLCMRATLQPASEMRIQLPHWRHKAERGIKGCKVYMAYDEDKFVGWAMVHPYWGELAFYVYIKRAYRRKGIATQLLRKAKRGRKKLVHVAPWDTNSSDFYRPFIEKSQTSVMIGYRLD